LISIVPTANGEDPPLARPDFPHKMSDRVTGKSLLDWFLPSRPSRQRQPGFLLAQEVIS
jgi:hypothetical protein